MDIFCILLLKCPSENWARNRFNDCPVQKLTIHYDSILLQLLVHVWAGQTQLCSCLCILLCSIKSCIGSENTRICSGNILMYLASHMHCFQEQCHTNTVFFISKFFHESIFHKRFFYSGKLCHQWMVHMPSVISICFSTTRSTSAPVYIFVACYDSCWGD